MKINLKKIIVFIFAALILDVITAILVLDRSVKTCFAGQQNNITSISSLIKTYTTNKSNVKLTIGVLKSDTANFKVFGADFKELEPVKYEYEIGSISKTFTASMLCKALDEDLVNLDDSISKYLPLEPNTVYPTIKSLATHTAGYGDYPFDASTLSKKELKTINDSFYNKRLNIYQGINEADILHKIKSHVLQHKAYNWEYSNFGFTVLGTVLSRINGTSFKQLAEYYVQNDLGLTETRLGNGTGNLGNYWTWNDDDTYFAAGGIVSTVNDLLKYGQMHIANSPHYLALSHKSYQTFEKYGFSMGLGWIIDPETGYLWHNGGTSSYRSFIGIDKNHKTVVVVLSNYPSKDGDKDEDALDILGSALLDRLSNDDCDVFNVWPRSY